MFQFNTLRLEQNDHQFADILNLIFVYDNCDIMLQTPLKYVSSDPIDNVPAWYLDNNLATNGLQAITCTNVGIIYRRIFASFDLDELTTA